MTSPSISIITINYNNREGLDATLRSVAAQSHPALECIVVDGGSTDGSLTCLEDHAEYITHQISEPDEGLYDAMNKGIALARGEYVIFLNSGDRFAEADTLATCFAFMQASPEADIYYADIHMFDSKTRQRMERFRHPAVLTLDYFRHDRPNHQASLIRKALFDEFGLYPGAYKLAADHWFYLKAFLEGKQYRFMDFCMIDYEDGGLSMSQGGQYKEEEKLIWRELLPAHIRHDGGKPGSFFSRLRRLLRRWKKIAKAS